MKWTSLVLLCTLLSGPEVLAFDTRRGDGDRIAILVDRSGGRHHAAIQHSIAEELARTLRQQKIDCRILNGTIDELHETARRDDLYVEIREARTGSSSFGGVGGGGRIGSVGIGGEVSIVGSHADATLHLYDGETLELVEEIEVDASSRGAALTGIGLGGRNSYGFLHLPFFGRRHERAAARQLGREAAWKILEAQREVSH